jgi:SAM-dependent methyltransferase
MTFWQKFKRHLSMADQAGSGQLSPLTALADKAYAPNSGTRKPDHYLAFYERLFENRRLEHISLLEIGVADGASLQMWREYLPNANIVGFDIIPPQARILELQAQNKIKYVQGDQSDEASLAKAVGLAGGGGFDVIIDDAAHIGALAKASFGYLFNNGLKPGGLYVIEDFGTGYFEAGVLPDSQPFADPDDISDDSGTVTRFPSHDSGMVGVVKQLVDELHGADIRADRQQRYPIAFLTFIPHVVMIGKAPAQPWVY